MLLQDLGGHSWQRGALARLRTLVHLHAQALGDAGQGLQHGQELGGGGGAVQEARDAALQVRQPLQCRPQPRQRAPGCTCAPVGETFDGMDS